MSAIFALGLPVTGPGELETMSCREQSTASKPKTLNRGWLSLMTSSRLASPVGPTVLAAVIVASGLLLGACVCATVIIEEPSAGTIADSDIIAVARVDRVVGRAPFTNAKPPIVMVTVEDGIKGAGRGEEIRLLEWVSGSPYWSTGRGPSGDDLSRWASKPVEAPRIGANLLVFLKRVGPHDAKPLRGMDGSIFVDSPIPSTVEIVRGTAWFTFSMQAVPPTITRGSAIEIRGVLKNRSSDTMSFDLRNAQVRQVSTPIGFVPIKRWRELAPPPVRLAPGASQPFSFPAQVVSAGPIGMPGSYWLDFKLPANVNNQGSDVSLYFQLEGEATPLDAATAARMVFAATVDSIFPFRPEIGPVHGVSLSQHQFLLGELAHSPPGNVLYVDWRSNLPMHPVRGGRYLFFLDGNWQLFHVAEASQANLEQVRRGLSRGGSRE